MIAILEARSKSEAINDEFPESFVMRLIKFHDCECYFYRNIAPIIDIPVPKVYKMTKWILGEQEGRRKSETFVVEYYLECLTSNLGADKVPYTHEQLERSYQLCFLTQAFQTLGNTIFMTANSRVKDRRLLQAHFDAGVLKALHAWQDCLWLLEGDLKDIYARFASPCVFVLSIKNFFAIKFSPHCNTQHVCLQLNVRKVVNYFLTRLNYGSVIQSVMFELHPSLTIIQCKAKHYKSSTMNYLFR